METGKPKGMRKRTRGSVFARAGRPAKAGKRKLPSGGHPTTPEHRAHQRWLHGLRTGPKAKPLNQINLILTGTQPDLEALVRQAVRS